MKSAVSVLAFLAAMSSTVTATIVLGIRTNYDFSEDNVAWIQGEDPCEKMVKINSRGDNPCGSQFTLSNGYTYGEVNCGGNNYGLVNADGSPNAVCHFNDNHGENIQCDSEFANGLVYWEQQWTC